MERAVVIVGASQCGATAAGALREHGYEGRLVLIGDEATLPYERPPLSKEILQGKRSQDEILIKAGAWYLEHEVELVLGERAVSVDPQQKEVVLASGARLRYEQLLLATGGRPRQLPGVPPTERIFYLRTLDDATRLAARLTSGSRLAIVGAGFIGAEVAAAARRLGVEVTLLETFDAPLTRVLGSFVGNVFAGIHRDEGVDLRTGEGVVSVEDIAETVTITTTSGSRIEADAVVIGVGMQPNVELAESTGIDIDNGIVVDEFCRTTVPGVFAAGDVACHYHPLFRRHLRVEHYDNAVKQGTVAARNIVGQAVAFDDPHWFWSDQYEHNLQLVGSTEDWDELVIRGNAAERNFSAFYLRDGRVQAVFALNRGRDVLRARKLVQSQVPLDPAVLRDETVDLRRLT